MSAKKKMTKTKEKVTQVLGHALESLKLLEMLEKGTLAKARTFIKLPMGLDNRKKTNEKIMNSLKRMGVASQVDVDALQARIEKLEEKIGSLPTGSKPKEKSSTQEMSGTLPQG